MAETKSTDHLLPDIRDEGKIKRYGFMIVIAVLVVLLFLFVAWATYRGQLNQQQDLHDTGNSSRPSGVQP